MSFALLRMVIVPMLEQLAERSKGGRYVEVSNAIFDACVSELQPADLARLGELLPLLGEQCRAEAERQLSRGVLAK